MSEGAPAPADGVAGDGVAGDGAALGGADLDRLLDTVLTSLRRDRTSGAAALWASFDASARGSIGDVEALARALGNPLLAPLVGHAQARREPWQRRGAAARTTLAVTGEGGDARYLVSARRRPEHGWRLTGLRRDDLPLT